MVRKKQLESRRCEFCGVFFTPVRVDQKFHSSTCRSRAHRAKQRVNSTDAVFFHAYWTPEERGIYRELSQQSAVFADQISTLASRFGDEAARLAVLAAWAIVNAATR